MATKKYKAKSHVALSVVFKSGKSGRVSFQALTGGGSIYVTNNPIIQEALENHPKFGHLFKLDTTFNPNPIVEEKVEEPVAQSNGIVIRVSGNDEAKDYLADKFGISRSKMRTRSAIEEAAAKNSITFEWV